MKWGRHGRVLPRAAVELAPALPTPKPTTYGRLSAISDFDAMIFVLKLRMCCEGETGETHSPELNLRSRNYQGRKSELCVLGTEKRLMYFQDVAGLTAVNKVSRLTRLIAISCLFLTETVVLTGLSNWPILLWERLGPPTLLTFGHRNTEINKCRNAQINVEIQK